MSQRLLFPLQMALILAAAGCVLSSATYAQDWPSRAGGQTRNAAREQSRVPVEFEINNEGKGKNTKWIADVGMGVGSEPAIANGLVWVGGSNRTPRDPNFTEDAGVLFCFRERDGKFLYQHSSRRREEGRNHDSPGYGIASTPWIEEDKLYFCTNRCETACLDIKPLIDGTGTPTEVWKVDMVEKYGVFPGVAHIASRHLHCSPFVWGDFVYVNTTHSVRPYLRDELKERAEPAPSLVCFNRHSGELQWSDNSPGNQVLGPQWNNPTVIRAGGRDQVVMGQGDGWVRSFDCRTGKLIWKFDMNEKLARLKLGEDWQFEGHLRQAIAEPVLYNERLFLVGGFEYEFGASTGRVCCIDPSKTGDISDELMSKENSRSPNPNSGLIWEFRGSPSGADGWKADQENPNVMHSSFGSAAVAKGFVVVTDLNGCVHCLDEKSGNRLWSYDTLGAIWGSPLIMGDQIIASNEEGSIFSIPLSKTLDKGKVRQNDTCQMLQSSPVFANDSFYFSSYSRLFAIAASDPNLENK